MDTTGTVRRPGFARPLSWSDLDAFTQGYIEALFASAAEALDRQAVSAPDGPDTWGFRHLAPETLAAILKDCAAALADRLAEYANTAGSGRLFWTERQQNQLNGIEPRFPPLTVYLADDGKLYAKATSSPAQVPGESSREDHSKAEASR